MPDTDSSQPATPHSNARFATTHWTVVLAAGSPDSSRYREALETLCQTYWFPLYAYLRRRGYERHAAEDHTQAFFARLLQKAQLQQADPRRGRFRSFLLTSFKNFVNDEWDRDTAQKRSGSQKLVSLDIESAESRYVLEPSHNLTPEMVFEKSWALTVLDRAMTSLKTEYYDTGKEQLFELLKTRLPKEKTSVSCSTVAAELGTTEGAVKVAIHRLRQRYRDLVRHEVAQTVSNPDLIDDEIRALFAALAQ